MACEERILIMQMSEPYFMQNEEWYYLDESELKYKLTEKAPPKAVESYREFYRLLEVNEE